jgi:fumarate hydratase, class II
MTNTRIERDSLGEVRLPGEVYYGAQTQRAVENFPISGQTLPRELIHALGLVKLAAATVNRDLGQLTGSGSPHPLPLSQRERGVLNEKQVEAASREADPITQIEERGVLNKKQVEALLTACREVADGKFDDQFPIDVFQTGSGTSSNMNANEVIANRAIELAGGDRFQPEKPIHPNDHVNRGQSTNDVFPTAIHLAAAQAVRNELMPALKSCGEVLSEKARQWQEVLKIGRTHLADAVPMTLGQEIGGLARQMEKSVDRAAEAVDAVLELPIGGTAVGTGLNAHPEFGRRVCEFLAAQTGIPFVEAADHFEANAQRDGLVECHALLKTIAITLFSVANNIRWLASGPRCGFYELKLPGLQPGSSIMPGKVNPVLCEGLMQVCARVLGNDETISFCGAAGGQFQLNVMMPVMGDAIIESIGLLTCAVRAFTEKCLQGMEANIDICQSAVERSLAMVTALNPLIGYEQAAALAKEAFRTGKTIRDLCREKNILPEDQLRSVLDPWRMI